MLALSYSGGEEAQMAKSLYNGGRGVMHGRATAAVVRSSPFPIPENQDRPKKKSKKRLRFEQKVRETGTGRILHKVL